MRLWIALGSLAAVCFLGMKSCELGARLEAEERQQLHLERCVEEYRRIKEGASNAMVWGPELIEMFANDADCIENIRTLYFVCDDIGDPRFLRVDELHNVEDMGFYCGGVPDGVVSKALQLPSLNRLSFESAGPSDKVLERLSDCPSLESVEFCQVMPDETIQQLREAMPGVEIVAPFLRSTEEALRTPASNK
ncbi:MAG: hypothetical protein AAF589_01415 [Planctomycetota bacterium]